MNVSVRANPLPWVRASGRGSSRDADERVRPAGEAGVLREGRVAHTALLRALRPLLSGRPFTYWTPARVVLAISGPTSISAPRAESRSSFGFLGGPSSKGLGFPASQSLFIQDKPNPTVKLILRAVLAREGGLPASPCSALPAVSSQCHGCCQPFGSRRVSSSGCVPPERV